MRQCSARLREPALRGAWHVGELGTNSRMEWLGRMAMRPNDGDGMRDFAVKKFKCALALKSYAEVRYPSKKTPLAHASKKNLCAQLASRAGGNLNFRRKTVSLDLLVLLGQAKRTINIALSMAKGIFMSWHYVPHGTSVRLAPVAAYHG